MTNEPIPAGTTAAPPIDQSLVTYTHIIYALHALSVIIGLTTAVTIIFNFVFSIPSIIAVIMNYARQSAVRGTYLESHFRWQIRTFWFALAWLVAIGAISFVLLIIVVGIVTWYLGVALVGVWLIYRVARGWLALRDRRPMYV
jgi:uncharacterized membrane protein